MRGATADRVEVIQIGERQVVIGLVREDLTMTGGEIHSGIRGDSLQPNRTKHLPIGGLAIAQTEVWIHPCRLFRGSRKPEISSLDPLMPPRPKSQTT